MFTLPKLQINNTVMEEWAIGKCQNCSLLLQNCAEDPATDPVEDCNYFFALFNLDDAATGIILVFLSLFVLCVALLFMVKLLTSLLKGELKERAQQGLE
jgi:hypothetical protein